MNVGVKVSTAGHSIDGQDKENVVSAESVMEPYLIASLAVAFVYGAEMAIQRYITAANATKQDVNHIFECIYETSNLVENLDIVDHYLSMCGQTIALPFNIRVMRNHIRHDYRENLNKPNKNVRTRRANVLGVDERLLVSMGFEPEEIKIGGTLLKIKDARAFTEGAGQYHSRQCRDCYML